MELIPILSTIILVATISTFILAVGAYILFKIHERQADQHASKHLAIERAELLEPANIGKDEFPGDDIKETDRISRIAADKEKSATLIFKIPDSVEEDDFDLKITIEGTDDNGDLHETIVNFVVSIEKEDHDLRIQRAVLARSALSCERTTTLEYKILNEGTDTED